MSDEIKIVTKDDLINKRFKVVTGPSGNSYRIRCLDTVEVVKVLGALPATVDQSTEESLFHQVQTRGTEFTDALILCCEAGLVDPKLTVEEIQDLLPFGDMTFIANAILDQSGLSGDVGPLVREPEVSSSR